MNPAKLIDARWVTGSNEDVDIQTFRELLCLEILNFGTYSTEIHPDKATFGILGLPSNHWSRVQEIPWALKMLDLKPSDDVLEVGGSGATLQFIAAGKCRRYANVDKTEKYIKDAEASRLNQLTGRKVTFHCMDFRRYVEIFGRSTWNKNDKVVSISTIEHDPNPLELLWLIWGQLKVGGRLVLTLDVAGHLGPDHWVDHERLLEIARAFNFALPQGSCTQAQVTEADGTGRVDLRALMVCLEKVG